MSRMKVRTTIIEIHWIAPDEAIEDVKGLMDDTLGNLFVGDGEESQSLTDVGVVEAQSNIAHYIQEPTGHLDGKTVDV